MGQEIITYGIGILVAIYLCIKIYRFFCNRKKGVNRCDGCPGCIIKSQNHRHPSMPESAPENHPKGLS